MFFLQLSWKSWFIWDKIEIQLITKYSDNTLIYITH